MIQAIDLLHRHRKAFLSQKDPHATWIHCRVHVIQNHVMYLYEVKYPLAVEKSFRPQLCLKQID
jgi:hypothetical protein